MKKPIGTVSSSIAWSCPWYNIRQDEILLPDGSSGTYNIVQKAPSVWIVPVTADGKIVLLPWLSYSVRPTYLPGCTNLPVDASILHVLISYPAHCFEVMDK
jgi:hypothetical protein